MAMKNDPNSLTLKNLDLRTSQFRRNPNLEALLDELCRYLAPVEAEIEKSFTSPVMPPFFLVGNPRSGTSIFMQFLSASDAFSIPSNLLSRFYYAPYLGARIQELLTDPKFDYKNELSIEKNKSDLLSELGRTKGMLAPSEILHFWRRFLPRYDPEYLDDMDCEQIDIVGLRKGVAVIESVFAKPFAAKAFMMQYNLDVLFRAFPNCIVGYLRRKPIFIMQSILRAREAHYGERTIWWSVKPKQYGMLRNMDVYHQIAGQVYYTDLAIRNQLSGVPERNKLIIDYEQFCLQPRRIADAIEEKYTDLGLELDLDIGIADKLEPKNQIRIPVEEIERMEKAYEYFEALCESPQASLPD